VINAGAVDSKILDLTNEFYIGQTGDTESPEFYKGFMYMVRIGVTPEFSINTS
jgi:hypothetical protein